MTASLMSVTVPSIGETMSTDLPSRKIVQIFWPWRTQRPRCGSAMLSIFADQLRGEVVDAHAHQFAALAQRPGVSSMVAHILRNLETGNHCWNDA